MPRGWRTHNLRASSLELARFFESPGFKESASLVALIGTTNRFLELICCTSVLLRASSLELARFFESPGFKESASLVALIGTTNRFLELICLYL